MDETNKATQDSLRATGRTSGGDKGSTSKEQPQTYTEEQVTKRISDELAKVGRNAKSLEAREAQLTALGKSLEADKAQIAKWQEEREEEELMAAQGSPEALTLLQRKHALRKKEAEFAEKQSAFDAAKAGHEAELQETRDVKREVTIWEIAGDDIDPAKLKDTCDKLNAQTEEQIKAIADSIRPEKAGDKTPSRLGAKAPFSLKADSSVTTGVGKDLSDMSADEKIRYALEHSKK